MNDILFSVTDASRVWGPDGKPRKSKVRPGWPDVTCLAEYYHCRQCIPHPVCFFIETKTQTGRVSPLQAACHKEIEKRGFKVCIPRSLEDVERLLLDLGVELRARISA